MGGDSGTTIQRQVVIEVLTAGGVGITDLGNGETLLAQANDQRLLEQYQAIKRDMFKQRAALAAEMDALKRDYLARQAKQPVAARPATQRRRR